MWQNLIPELGRHIMIPHYCRFNIYSYNIYYDSCLSLYYQDTSRICSEHKIWLKVIEMSLVILYNWTKLTIAVTLKVVAFLYFSVFLLMIA